MKTLFDSINVGAITAPNRIIMAPMTRARGTRNHVPLNTVPEYYAQRASAGLIISEAIGITQEGLGWPYATGLWTEEQIDGWRKVTEAVHTAGGRIVAQLWHMGRVVHPSFLEGAQPVSASITTAPGDAFTYAGKQPYEPARALSLEEIPRVLADFKTGARNAMLAGFDGVQIHAANGYLIDQFLKDGSNFRQDIYGGSIENRIRLMREVTEVVAGEVGADRTGIRLSPNGTSNGVTDSNPIPLFIAAVKALSEIGVAHLELREPLIDGTFGVGDFAPIAPLLRQHYNGVLIRNSDFTMETAKAALLDGSADAISFGRYYITNPDLPYRFANKLPLIEEYRDTWFTQEIAGYTDYQTISN